MPYLREEATLLDTPDVWTEGLAPQAGVETVAVPRELIGKVWSVVNEFQHRVPVDWAHEHGQLTADADKLLDDLWYVLGGRKGFFGAAAMKERQHGRHQ